MKNNLIRLTLAATLAFPTLALLANAAVAGKQDFIVHNLTGFSIIRLNVSSAGSNEWEEDVLRSDILGSGESVRVNFGGGTQDCVYDIRAIFSDGEAIEERRIDLCNTTDFSFR